MSTRVLIVDDEADLVEMLALRLSSTGCFEIATASDGAEGLARAAQFKPHVILLDNIMPGMDGWETCRRLRELPEIRTAAIVMMTAGSPHKSEEKAREMRLDGLIFKPYDPARVVDTLKSVTQARSKENSC